jgi:sulfate permease, SulP family
MSRPIIRRSYRGDEIFSKRIRSADDMQLLLRTGRDRAILELQGVLFFGNTDDLTQVVNETLKRSKVVLLDLRGMSDVDVSGTTILSNLIARAHQRGKLIAFCNLPIARLSSANFAEEAAGIFPDLDNRIGMDGRRSAGRERSTSRRR